MRLELTYFFDKIVPEKEKKPDYLRTARWISSLYGSICRLEVTDEGPCKRCTFVIKGERRIIVGGSAWIYQSHGMPAVIGGDPDACKIAEERSRETKRKLYQRIEDFKPA